MFSSQRKPFFLQSMLRKALGFSMMPFTPITKSSIDSIDDDNVPMFEDIDVDDDNHKNIHVMNVSCPWIFPLSLDSQGEFCAFPQGDPHDDDDSTRSLMSSTMLMKPSSSWVYIDMSIFAYNLLYT